MRNNATFYKIESKQYSEGLLDIAPRITFYKSQPSPPVRKLVQGGSDVTKISSSLTTL